MTTATVFAPVEIPEVESNHSDALYEIIEGRFVELPPMSALSVRVAFKLGARLEMFVEAKQLGRAITENLFGLAPRKSRRPDVAFVSYKRWAEDLPLPTTDPWNVIPNLVVEVVSSNDVAQDLMKKVHEYLAAGVEQVWVIFVEPTYALIFESLTQVRGVLSNGLLEGGAVLPGFQTPLADLLR